MEEYFHLKSPFAPDPENRFTLRLSPNNILIMDQFPNIFHLVIPSLDKKRLLVRRSGRTLSLPLVIPPKDDSSPWVNAWNAFAGDLGTVISTVLGIEAYVVTILWDRHPDPPVFTEVVVQVEPDHYTFAISEGLAWVDRAAVLMSAADWQSPHEDLDVRLLLTAFFARIGGRAPGSPSPWRTTGWFQDIECWALSVIKHHGMHVVGRLRQRRNMHHSTVLSCEVNELRVGGTVLGNNNNLRSSNSKKSVYIKATHPDVPEAKMVLTVSSVMEGFVPKILAIDEKRNAIIQLGAEPMDDSDPKAVMGMLADLHIVSIQHVDALKAGGVPDRGLAWLSSCITEMLCDPILELCEKKEPLCLLKGRVREVKGICKRLLDYGIPDTLVHGDCDESNIRRGVEEPGSAFSLIDWATCCIGHPFFDLARITVEDDWGNNRYEGAKESYFKNWTPFVCHQKMLEAFPLVWPLFLCYNLSILLGMFKMMEPVEQPSMLRRIEGRLMDIVEALDEIPGNKPPNSWDGEGYEPNTYHFVIPNATGDRILVRRRSGYKLSLPLMSPPKTNSSIWVNNWDKDVDKLRSVLKAEMGVNAYALRPLWIRPDTRYGIEEVVLVLEVLDKMSKEPDGLEWISRKEAMMGEWDEIGHESVDLKGLLGQFFDETSAGSAPERRAPWRSVGWLKETMNWIASVLSKSHAVDVVRNTPDSCVLRCTVRWDDNNNTLTEGVSAKDAEEVLYVKTVHPSLSMAKMMAAIPSISGGIVPAVVAIDETRNTYIQRDARSRDDDGSSFSTELLMKTLADVQIRSMGHLDTLKDAGVPVFNTEWLQSCIAGIPKPPLLDMCGEAETVAKLRAEPKSLGLRDVVASFCLFPSLRPLYMGIFTWEMWGILSLIHNNSNSTTISLTGAPLTSGIRFATLP